MTNNKSAKSKAIKYYNFKDLYRSKSNGRYKSNRN